MPSIKKLLSDLIEANGRMHNRIKELFQNSSNQSEIIDEIKAHTKSPCSPIKGLKILILLHNIQLTRSKTLEREGLLVVLKSINCTQVDAFQRFLLEKVVKEYILYLERKIYGLGEAKLERNLKPMDQFYQKLNLIKRSVSFSDIFSTFGRYYKHTYPFIIDLNIIVGRDINKQYLELAKKFLKIKHEVSQQIVDQIENIHEKMEMVFLNCYYYKYLINFIPKLLRIQKYLAKEEKKQNALYFTEELNQQNSEKVRQQEKSDLSAFPTKEQFTNAENTGNNRLDLIKELNQIAEPL